MNTRASLGDSPAGAWPRRPATITRRRTSAVRSPVVANQDHQSFPIMITKRYNWSGLNHLQVGRYAEYHSKMEFTMYGFHVYGSEVDDHGVDFIASRMGERYYEVQVKSLRGLGYIFMPKSKTPMSDRRLISVVLFTDGQTPDHYVIPLSRWETPNSLLVSHDYVGKKSDPEWGINISKKNMPALERFRCDDVIMSL